MTFDASRHFRTLRRYRLMFKTSLGAGVFGVVLVVAGVLASFVGPMPVYLPIGLFVVAAAWALAMRVVSSTARILESDGYFMRSY